jgi:hypothetical protein
VILRSVFVYLIRYQNTTEFIYIPQTHHRLKSRMQNKFVIRVKYSFKGKKGKAIPVIGCGGANGWDVMVPTFSRQVAHRWQLGCQPYTPATVYPPGRFLVLISLRGWVGPRAIVRLEGSGQLKNSRDLNGNRTHNHLSYNIIQQKYKWSCIRYSHIYRHLYYRITTK